MYGKNSNKIMFASEISFFILVFLRIIINASEPVGLNQMNLTNPELPK